MLTLAAIALLSLIAPQQHSYTPAEIDDGRRIYQSSCGTCHGALGDAVPGIDFARAQFKRSSTDEDLVRVIGAGVPGTSMPPFKFSEPQALTLVAYLRNITTTPIGRDTPVPAGNAANGKTIVEGKGACLSCHSISNTGNPTGPDLTAIAAPRTGRAPIELQRSLLEPNAEVRAENRTIRVAPKTGDELTGKLLNQDTHTIQLLEPKQGRLASFEKSTLKEFGIVPSPMPSFRDRLTAQELNDVVSYLVTLKGNAQ